MTTREELARLLAKPLPEIGTPEHTANLKAIERSIAAHRAAHGSPIAHAPRTASAPRFPSKPTRPQQRSEKPMTMTRAEVQRMIDQRLGASARPTVAQLEWAKNHAYRVAAQRAQRASSPGSVRELGGTHDGTSMESMRWGTPEGVSIPNIAAHPQASQLLREGRRYMAAKLGYASLSEARSAVAADIMAMERKPFWQRTSREKATIDALARDGLAGLGGVQ